MNPSGLDMVSRFKSRWKGLWLESGEVVTLLLSGGGDSTALFLLLYKACIDFNCLHFEHDSPGDFAARSAEFCQQLCDRFEIPLTLARADAKALLAEGDLSWEAAARQLRYAHLQTLEGIFLTAHTADDQAETLVMRLLDGAGLAGLSGIRVQRSDGVVRPLLEFRRQELHVWLRLYGQDWMDDPTNESGNDRAVLRSGLMTTLLEGRPSLVETLCRTAQSLAADEDALREMAKAWLEEHGGGGDHWPLEPLNRLHPAIRHRVLREIWRRSAPPGRRPLGGVFRECERLLKDGGDNRAVILPGIGSLRRLGQILWMEPHSLGPASWSFELPTDWTQEWRSEHLLVVPPGVDVEEKDQLSQEGWLRFPLKAGLFAKGKQVLLRSRRPGDRFRGKCVKKLLAATGQPPWTRDRWPLLVEGDQIVEIPGIKQPRSRTTDAGDETQGFLLFWPWRWKRGVS